MANKNNTITLPETLVRAQKEYTVGQKATLQCKSPTLPIVVAFEDDGETGYFLAVDISQKKHSVLDGLHIYNVKNITDKHLPSVLKIVWSKDGKKTLLLINDFAHAAFDFKQRRGYCRNNFPPPVKEWTKYSHEWDNTVMNLF